MIGRTGIVSFLVSTFCFIRKKENEQSLLDGVTQTL